MTLAMPHITPDFQPMTVGDFGIARSDFRWWSENLQYIADKDSKVRHTFLWNPIQTKLNTIVQTQRNAFGGGRYIILKARQMGLSTWITARSAWRADTQENFRALHVAHDGDGSSNMLDMVKLSHNSLPERLALSDGQVVSVRPIEKASNRAELRLWFDDKGVRESHVRIKTAGVSGDVGRSSSLNLLHISEAGNDVYDDGAQYGAAKQGLSKMGEVFVEGTPDGAYGWYYNAFQKAVDEHGAYVNAKADNPLLEYNGFIPIFFPWYEMPGYRIPLIEGEIITPESDLEHKLMAGLVTENGYKVRPDQIKYMRYVMADMPESLEMTPEQWFQQEYASNRRDCFITSGNGYFVSEYVEKMWDYADKYEKEHKIKRYTFNGSDWVPDPYGPLRLIEDPCQTATYVIGGDAAKGLKTGDYDTAVIIKRVVDGPDIVVGYWRTHEPDKGLHALALAELGKWHCNALIAVENNPGGHGNEVNKCLSALRYPRIYLQTFQDEAKYKGAVAPEYGFETNKKTKTIYLGDLQACLRKSCENIHHLDGLLIPFTAIVEELRTFQKVDGKTEAAKGSYDDLVIALAIPTHLRKKVAATFRCRAVLDKVKVNGPTLEEIIRSSFGKKALKQFKEITRGR